MQITIQGSQQEMTYSQVEGLLPAVCYNSLSQEYHTGLCLHTAYGQEVYTLKLY